MPKKRILMLYVIAWGSAIALPVLYALNHYGIGYIKVNLTPSIDKGIYWVMPGSPVTKGDDVAFHYQGTFFEKGIELLKHCVAMEGDTIERRGNQVFVNQFATPAMLKPTSLQGKALIPGPTGVVPTAHFYVLGDHKDSFDSRYTYVGFVHQDQVIGRAVKIVGWGF